MKKREKSRVRGRDFAGWPDSMFDDCDRRCKCCVHSHNSLAAAFHSIAGPLVLLAVTRRIARRVRASSPCDGVLRESQAEGFQRRSCSGDSGISSDCRIRSEQVAASHRIDDGAREEVPPRRRRLSTAKVAEAILALLQSQGEWQKLQETISVLSKHARSCRKCRKRLCKPAPRLSTMHPLKKSAWLH